MIVGVLGAGQLGRMLALAGYPLGLRFRFLDPTPESPASHVAEQVVGDYGDPAALDRFADGLDVVTYEFENFPVEAVRRLALRVPVYPPPIALEVAQDRLQEKSTLNRLGIPTAPWEPVDSRDDLQQALTVLGVPAVLKTRRLGYDGKGQHVIRTPDEADAAWQTLGGVPLILEGYVPFRRELSVLGVRSQDGEMPCYPVVENEHRHGVLRRSVAPAPSVTEALQRESESYVSRVMDELDYVGVLAVELFDAGGRLLANEIAPRVHNSGHWTIEGATTSQFENHVRAVAGLPLGVTAARGCSGMLNLLGTQPDVAAVLRVPGVHLHLYGKSARPGRKLGHVTVLAADRPDLASRLTQLETVLG